MIAYSALQPRAIAGTTHRLKAFAAMAAKPGGANLLNTRISASDIHKSRCAGIEQDVQFGC